MSNDHKEHTLLSIIAAHFVVAGLVGTIILDFVGSKLMKWLADTALVEFTGLFFGELAGQMMIFICAIGCTFVGGLLIVAIVSWLTLSLGQLFMNY